MPRADQTPAQLKFVQDAMQRLRVELLRHAYEGAQGAGFADPQTRAFAVLMTLVGAAQLAALEHRELYPLFRSICGDMAASSADAVVTRGIAELGPEFGGMH